MIPATATAPPLDRLALTFPPPSPQGGAGKGENPKKRERDPLRRAAKYELRATAGRLLPEEGVAQCGAFVRWNGGKEEPWASVKLSEAGASWCGLISCGSVWLCPMCAAKIAAERRAEVKTAIDRAKAEGLSVFMATFTIPHHRFDECAELIGAVAMGFRQIQAGAPWERAKLRAGFEGAIRSLELTHGDNGWHPHLHCLFLVRGGDDADDRAADLARFLFQRWSANIARAGFGECDEKAWQFERCDTAEAAGEYVSKWGPDWELTHGHLKTGKRGGRSPWRILKDYNESGDKRDAALFIQYAEAAKGRRQLTWSKGLKARFKIGEVEDAALADREEPEAQAVVEIHGDAVLRLAKKRGAMAAVLNSLEEHGVDGILKCLHFLGVPEWEVRVLKFPLQPPDGYERVKTMLGAHVARKVFGVEHV